MFLWKEGTTESEQHSAVKSTAPIVISQYPFSVKGISMGFSDSYEETK